MKKILSLLIIFVMTASAVFAENYNVYKLDNGQTVVIYEVKSNPIVTIDTWIKTGSINETDKNNGVSHFLEHLFFKGTQNHGPGEFDTILENKGGLTNAATSKDFTHYYVTIPSKHFDLALNLHADMLLHPLVPRKELEMERKVVLEEISKDMNSPNRVVYENLIDMMYTNHPYKRKVLGTREIIETIPRDEILEYYNQWYFPSNMVTVIAGDVNSAEAIEKIKKEFQAEPKKAPKCAYPVEKPITAQVKKVENLPTQSGYMLIGFRGTKITNPDSYALDVLSTILGDGRSSIFYQSIKEQKQLAYDISAVNTGFKDDGIFYVSANFIPENADKLEKTIFDDIKTVQKRGVTQEQVNLAKNIIERDTYYNRESVSNIAQEIGYTMVTTNDIKFYKNYLDNIKKVTPEDVKRVANKYLGIEKSAVSIVLPEKKKEVQISNKKPLNTEAKLISESSGTKKFQLADGASLLMTPNTSNDIVAISIFAQGGEFIEKIPGTGSLMGSVLLKGTKNYSALELAQIMEDKGIKIMPGIKTDAFTLTVLTTRNEYDKTLEILNEIVNNARLDDYEIEKARADKLSFIKKNRDVPLNIALEEYRTLIYKGSPYSNSTKVIEKTLPTIQKEDIVEYYNKIFAPQNVIISINGNVETQKTIDEFTKIFNSTKGEKYIYNSVVPPISEPRKSIKTKPDTQTAWIILGWQAAGLGNQKDYATLQVIDAMLGTGMSSRLFKNLREQEGLAYQLGSSYTANILKGAFIVYIGTNPNTLERSEQKLFEEINRLKKEFVSSKELKEAKDKLIGNYILGQETNLDKATITGWFETSGRGYEFRDNYETLINSVTESDIIEAANKYFNNNYVLSIVK